MKLIVVSHKVCQNASDAPDSYLTDGGFPVQMKAISELFDSTKILVPCVNSADNTGLMPLVGKNLEICPLTEPAGLGFRRKLNFPFWLLKNGLIIWREARLADAVHAPVPGDVGTIGMLVALILRKPLFVRYCGNWFVRRTAAETFWIWMMERFAGGRNVMLATGGGESAPSPFNRNIKWIFATSLSREAIKNAAPRKFPENGKLKLIIACRQEKGKGTHVVIESLNSIIEKIPGATLDVVGGGSQIENLKTLAKNLKIADKIKFHGKVESAKVIELMKRAHIFCYPTASEGFPKVVLEALACGLPVVTTPVSVLPHLINQERGVLLNKPTAENMAKAVAEICADAEKYERMSVAATLAAADYSLENWRDFIGDVLRRSWRVSSLSSTETV